MSDYKKLKNKNVLVVDDNILNRIAARRTMSNYGIIVTEVKDGQEAIDAIIEETFDIILMDIQMPVLDGIEATKIIREKLKINTPIIALTGSDSKEQIDLCLSIGMNAYIIKPFTKETLLQTLLNIDHQKSTTLIEKSSHTNTVSVELYSLDKIKEISRGDDEFVNKMVRLFIESATKTLDMMLSAFQEKDFIALSALAHRITPSIHDLNISQITYEIKQLELLSKGNPKSELIPEFLLKIESVLRIVINQMTKELT